MTVQTIIDEYCAMREDNPRKWEMDGDIPIFDKSKAGERVEAEKFLLIPEEDDNNG